MTKIQGVRGMNDILPEQTPLWQFFENKVHKLLKAYGYQEIRMPIVEKSELFHRGVGENTDIVSKETYDFEDRNGEALTLRPEGTAGCVRAAIENGLLRNASQKLWYMGPMFRHERPQKGRYRQFHQLGIEAFGTTSRLQDAELMTLTWRLWQNLGLSDHVVLEINNIGSADSIERYKKDLVAYLTPYENQLDDDSRHRLTTNPLRILDTKNQATKALLKDAPVFQHYLDEQSHREFQKLIAFLENQGIPFTINPQLVRGIDYYSHIVFEWTCHALGGQGTICAGGRYDSLVGDLGGPQTPAVGLAMGIERLLMLIEQRHGSFNTPNGMAIYIVNQGDKAKWQALKLKERIHSYLPELMTFLDTSGGSFKAQFKRADKYKAELAVVIGEQEVSHSQYRVKWLQSDKPQWIADENELITYLKSHFQSHSQAR